MTVASINRSALRSGDRAIRDAVYDGVPLSPAEKQVLRLAADGLTYQEIADKLFKSIETVKMQIKVSLSKLKARNTVHAVAIAISLELI